MFLLVFLSKGFIAYEHCRVEIFMSHQLLDSSNISSRFKQMSGKRMPQCVATYTLVNLYFLCAFTNGFL